ncbi:MAG: hypothetical protein ACRDUX_35055 [Mycobacterium sp.]
MSCSFWGVLGVAGVIAVATPAQALHFLVRAFMEAPPGSTLEVPVDLYGAEGALVATARNDLLVAPPLVIRAKLDGTPDCAAWYSEYPTTFTSLPTGCAGDACTGVRASIDVTPPVDIQAIVYSCIVEVPPDAPPGFYPLLISNAAATDAAGNALPTTIGNALIPVPELPKAAMLFVGTAEGYPGESVWIDVALESTVAAQVVGTVGFIEYDPLTPIVADGIGRPHCMVNPSVGQQSSFYFGSLPCCSLDVFIGSGDLPAFPSGAPMFSCLITISPDAPPGDYPLFCHTSNISAYDTGFIRSHCNGGAVRVLAPETPTLTPSVTPPPSSTPSARATFTPTLVQPTSTRTPAPADTSTIPPSLTPRPSDSSGCAIVVRPASNSAWLLWSPVAALLWAGLRRAGVHRAR